MAVHPLDPKVLETEQRSVKEKLTAAAASLELQNVDVAKSIDGVGSSFVHLGKTYIVDRPTPLPEGIRLKQLELKIAEVGKYIDGGGSSLLGDYLGYSNEVADIVWSLVVPKSLVGRVRKKLKLMRNPFRRAGEYDLGMLLGFFLARRMKPSLQFPSNRS